MCLHCHTELTQSCLSYISLLSASKYEAGYSVKTLVVQQCSVSWNCSLGAVATAGTSKVHTRSIKTWSGDWFQMIIFSTAVYTTGEASFMRWESARQVVSAIA